MQDQTSPDALERHVAHVGVKHAADEGLDLLPPPQHLVAHLLAQRKAPPEQLRVMQLPACKLPPFTVLLSGELVCCDQAESGQHARSTLVKRWTHLSLPGAGPLQAP